jgi:probable phosphoglycerate mutase
MTTTLYLVRHAPHALQGEVMVGRRPGIPLAEGASHWLDHLARRFRGERVDLVYASPMERAQATARVVADAAAARIETAPDLDELDLGEWTGRRLADMEREPSFQLWCRDRTMARAPGGESLLEAQLRMVRQAESACRAWPDGQVALVSHGDPIRCLLTHYLGLGLAGMDRFDIDPASVSVVVMAGWGAKVLSLNERVPG